MPRYPNEGCESPGVEKRESHGPKPRDRRRGAPRGSDLRVVLRAPAPPRRASIRATADRGGPELRRSDARRVLGRRRSGELAGRTGRCIPGQSLRGRPRSCRLAWLAARPAYLQTEVARFYEGPIDGGPDAPERRLNAWPLDEAYIDSVEGDPGAGLVNDPVGSRRSTARRLRAANEQGGETNIATGWHAIEFLLWGQDRILGPGGGRTLVPRLRRRGGRRPERGAPRGVSRRP